MRTSTEHNVAILEGMLLQEFQFNHRVKTQFGYKSYYDSVLQVKRTSGTYDNVPIMIESELMTDLQVGKFYSVRGEIISFTKTTETSYRKLFVYVKVFEIAETDEPEGGYANAISLSGHLCKNVVERTTPSGKHVADLLIAINKRKSGSDYIPCITWKDNASKITEANIGDYVQGVGRFQSRTYQKRLDDNTVEERTTYEVSLAEVAFCSHEDELKLECDET